MEVAWIGTGIMGAPMARRLARAGHHVRVFNRSPEKARPLAADGALVAKSLAEAVDGAEVMITMVTDTPDVEQVVAQAGPRLKAGALAIDMTTISPTATAQFAKTLAERGVDFLDAPVSGG